MQVIIVKFNADVVVFLAVQNPQKARAHFIEKGHIRIPGIGLKSTDLPSLQERPKWQRQQRNFKVGDLVLIADDNLIRNQFSLGLNGERVPLTT